MAAPKIGREVGKTLRRSLERLPEGALAEAFVDDEGAWVWLNAGWIQDGQEVHQYHKPTQTEVVRMLRDWPPRKCVDHPDCARAWEAK